ncbi:methyl-accepting chemotaxis protein [Zhaonella formicivorans]|uniref:methyl-accepting chemotaxis protein n=1 Tax=Zhaonella formicivorans TaxID=2528593 RepID=UPI0010F3B14B|nr:methyl-accepting chemotaxis protein [Zhaonella formicivorans]
MKSIKAAFIVLILIVTVLIFAAQTGYSFWNFKGVLMETTDQQMLNLVAKEAEGFNKSLQLTGSLANIIAGNLEANNQYDYELYVEAIKKYLEENKLAIGAGYWLEPFTYDSKTKYYGPYVYRTGDNLTLTWDYSNEEYDYFQYDWYQNGIKTDKQLVWSEPYYDPVSGVTMITVTSPVKKQGKVVGVTTTDIDLKEIQSMVARLKVGQGGGAFIVTGQGYYMAYKQAEKNLNDKITESKDDSIKALGKRIVSENKPGIGMSTLDGIESIVAFAPIGDTGLRLVVSMPAREIGAKINKIFLTNVILFILAILAFVMLLYLLTSIKIAKPLELIAKEAEKIAQGNLNIQNIQYTGNDEIGTLARSFNNMVANMRNLILKVIRSAEDVSAAAQELSASTEQSTQAVNQLSSVAEELAHGSSKQSQVVKNALSGVQERTAAVDSIAATVQTVSAASEETSRMALEGDKSMSLAISEMEKINASTREASALIDELSKRSQAIEQIVEMIGSIADQTNLLALNAAIEAARAGEQGRGFAVVAEEVRKLAEQSSQAAKEIAALIKQIQEDTAKAVDAMNYNNQLVQTGNMVIGEGAKAFQQIGLAVEKVYRQVQDVANSTVQLAKGNTDMVSLIRVIDDVAGQVAQSAQHMASSSEEQSATMEEIAASADTLARLAQELNEAVSMFKI